MIHYNLWLKSFDKMLIFMKLLVQLSRLLLYDFFLLPLVVGGP